MEGDTGPLDHVACQPRCALAEGAGGGGGEADEGIDGVGDRGSPNVCT